MTLRRRTGGAGRRTLARGALALCLIASVACRPDFGERDSLVSRMRILAVRGEPAEAKEDELVSYTLLAVTPDGPIEAPLATWGYCASPRRLIENGAAAATCLAGSELRPIIEGSPSARAPIPADACGLFGPEVIAKELRPRDPDVTGGYYQPLRVTVFDPRGRESAFSAIAQQRIACGLASATTQVASDFALRYQANTNPAIDAVDASLAGAPLAFDAIPRGARVTLRVTWSESSAERYVAYDPVARGLVDKRESMRVSWFVTGGELRDDRTGRDEGEPESFTENEWTAPTEARTTHLFVVLRDARGGVAFRALRLTTL